MPTRSFPPASAQPAAHRPPLLEPGIPLLPFRALRYDPAAVPLHSAVAPAADTLTTGQARRHRADGLHSVLHLLQPDDAGTARGAAAGAAERWERASRCYRAWVAGGVLRQDPEPALYLYEQDGPAGRWRGLYGELPLAPGRTGVVLPATGPGAAADPARADRELARMRVVGAQTEPVVLRHAGAGPALRAVAELADRTPLAAVRTADGADHRIWAVQRQPDLAEIRRCLAGRQAVVADGGHRYLAYHRLRDWRIPGGGAGLVLVVAPDGAPAVPHPATGLVLRPLHRT
ncbi:DUF1015 family protein [Kitasatospora sp. KL5]|uniref:DUF1015 family protein n=1 Tax=Kitasatospora sp. KL5 TaxID=3425125 RepID=UPI003D6DEED9